MAKLIGASGQYYYSLPHILAQHDAAYFRYAQGQMNNDIFFPIPMGNTVHDVCAAPFLRSARLRRR
ncbi:hypothetical protein LZP96_02655 [Enterobacteriaceae bacterium 155047]|uniref:hypothetical protein n=1 Tax=Huaxiibacter chinensis TaxID=2899785 RepID=UPI0018DF2B05|nr:hypothetical protein [Huaxiibacter chinensis]MCG5042961.1 hypothetical protein [Huaxiibacter chinensis]